MLSKPKFNMFKFMTTQTTKYTPFTFSYTEDEKGGLPKVYDSQGWEIATVHGADNTEREGLARLFASAPELLEVCQSALRILEHNCKSDASPAIALLKCAIAKAEGHA